LLALQDGIHRAALGHAAAHRLVLRDRTADAEIADVAADADAVAEQLALDRADGDACRRIQPPDLSVFQDQDGRVLVVRCRPGPEPLRGVALRDGQRGTVGRAAAVAPSASASASAATGEEQCHEQRDEPPGRIQHDGLTSIRYVTV